MEVLHLSNYTIYLGDHRAALRAWLRERDYSRIVVLTDEHTRALCWPVLAPSLRAYSSVQIEIPAGERFKNLDTCRQIWSQMMEWEIDRRALCLNLGGGVLGDMGGFCAATYKRGIDFVQVPTTLLSQVDASIGGKLGIDFNGVKNSIGLFQDPRAVFIDPRFLQTLPPRELRSGLAEIIKHGLIADGGQWERIAAIDKLGNISWEELIAPSLRIKQKIVEADPLEKGLRKALNYGHTVGHALESYFLEREAPLLHGEAIAIGMVAEAFLSHLRVGLAPAVVDQIAAWIIQHYGFRHLPESIFGDLLRLMQNDKKNEGGRINFSLIPAAGSVRIDQRGKPEEIRESLRYYNRIGGAATA